MKRLLATAALLIVATGGVAAIDDPTIPFCGAPADTVKLTHVHAVRVKYVPSDTGLVLVDSTATDTTTVECSGGDL